MSCKSTLSLRYGELLSFSCRPGILGKCGSDWQMRPSFLIFNLGPSGSFIYGRTNIDGYFLCFVPGTDKVTHTQLRRGFDGPWVCLGGLFVLISCLFKLGFNIAARDLYSKLRLGFLPFNSACVIASMLITETSTLVLITMALQSMLLNGFSSGGALETSSSVEKFAGCTSCSGPLSDRILGTSTSIQLLLGFVCLRILGWLPLIALIGFVPTVSLSLVFEAEFESF